MKFDFIKKSNILKRKNILTTILVACFLLLVSCFIFLYQLYMPLSKNVEETEFIVREGQSLKEIAENLRLERIIGNKLVFVLYVWIQGKTNNLQAGKYSLSSSMNIAEIAKKIVSGDVFHDWVKVTIPEGWTNKQIEEKLVELGILNPQKYTTYTVSTESFPFLADRPPGPSLEGYLFPDTYYFDKETDTVETVVKKMLVNFGEKLNQDLQEEIKRQGKTIFEVVILASIVQNEVSSPQDMAKVAGIFYNRFKLGIPLQSDATVNYITGKNLRQPLIEDTKVKSPYNTYLHLGLPPGPISNPGLEAIKAVIYPEETEYLYFLNPPDGTTIFSKTFQEHNANKRKHL